MRVNKRILLLLIAVVILSGKLSSELNGSSSIAVSSVSSVSVVRRVPNDEMKIALTFDDGPHGKYTEEILDILNEFGVKATFFVVGTNAASYPSIIERELSEGHEVENHTQNHTYLKKACDNVIKEEMMENQCIIAGITKYNTKYLRPPGGLFDSRLENIAAELGYKIILWSVDTCDWNHPTPENISANVLEDVRSGDIVLMHDYIGGSSPTPMALRLMLPKLIEKGYSFVTVSELLEFEND